MRNKLQIVQMIAEAMTRFLFPAMLCVLFIAGAIIDYDRRYPHPRDHFTPTRAIATIAILSATLLWLGWRFVQFIRQRR